MLINIGSDSWGSQVATGQEWEEAYQEFKKFINWIASPRSRVMATRYDEICVLVQNEVSPHTWMKMVKKEIELA